MDKLEIKQGSFIQQTQYFIPVEIDLYVVPARLGISDFFTCPIGLISLRLGFRRHFLSVLHPNLVSSPIKGILEILNLTTRCIPMDILAWTDCVRSSAGKIS